MAASWLISSCSRSAREALRLGGGGSLVSPSVLAPLFLQSNAAHLEFTHAGVFPRSFHGSVVHGSDEPANQTETNHPLLEQQQQHQEQQHQEQHQEQQQQRHSWIPSSVAVVAKLTNVPKYALKSDVLRKFPGCGLTLADAFTVHDDKLRPEHWQLHFPSQESFQRALALMETRRRLGSRVLHLRESSTDEFEKRKHQRRFSLSWRDVSLIMVGVPDDVKTEDIERFFQGYEMAPRGLAHVKLEHRGIRTPSRLRGAGETRNEMNFVERRTVVRFSSANEALRALREKHREFLGDRMIELRLMQ